MASAWSIGGQGYVLCGEYTSNSRRNDLWQYDPGLNHWNEHASLPSTARYGAYAFTIGGIGYIGAGNGANTPAGPYLTDLWAYDPSTNTWTAHTGIPDQGRFGSVAFTVGDTAYVFGGKQDDLTWTSELWRYVPASDAWTLMAPMPSTGRRYAMAFSTSDHGIVVGGENNNATVPDAWIYTPATNAWAYVPAYPGQGGWAGVNMNFGDTAYAGLGQNNGVPHKDLWSLDLNAITAVHEVPLTSNAFTVCPSLCTAGSIVRFNGKEELLRSIGRIALFDLTGRKVFEAMKGSDNTLRVPELGEGRYVLSVAFADGTSRGLPLTIVD